MLKANYAEALFTPFRGEALKATIADGKQRNLIASDATLVAEGHKAFGNAKNLFANRGSSLSVNRPGFGASRMDTHALVDGKDNDYRVAMAGGPTDRRQHQHNMGNPEERVAVVNHALPTDTDQSGVADYYLKTRGVDINRVTNPKDDTKGTGHGNTEATHKRHVESYLSNKELSAVRKDTMTSLVFSKMGYTVDIEERRTEAPVSRGLWTQNFDAMNQSRGGEQAEPINKMDEWQKLSVRPNFANEGTEGEQPNGYQQSHTTDREHRGTYQNGAAHLQ